MCLSQSTNKPSKPDSPNHVVEVVQVPNNSLSTIVASSAKNVDIAITESLRDVWITGRLNQRLSKDSPHKSEMSYDWSLASTELFQDGVGRTCNHDYVSRMDAERGMLVS